MAIKYGYKVNDDDSVTVIQGEDLELDVRVFESKSLLPFQSLNHTFTLRLRNADGTILTLNGTNVNNYLGWVRFKLTGADTEALPVAKAQNAEMTILSTQTGVKTIVQMSKMLNVLARLF